MSDSDGGEGKIPVWGVLQCVAGCCRVLQGGAGRCRALQGVAGCCWAKIKCVCTVWRICV